MTAELLAEETFIDQLLEGLGLEPLGAVKFLQSLGYEVKQEISGDYLMVPA